jgi:hypothetical protein
MFRTTLACLILIGLTACTETTEAPAPVAKTPTAAEQAEIDKARADAIAAECALYAKSSVTPEGC